ncbi:AAA family ATPase [Nocardia sp. CA-145437]|uniref:nSTAND1 domain-containing NTPase n=1 Tax=Nocardia sp. CA-145437 TaxID=3239980 RepID=UPI003D9723C6
MTESETDRIRSPRALFARRFAELYAVAGNPTLRRVATAAENRMRAAQGNRPGGASAQRISDWKAGRNVPARFESLLPVVLTLIDLARKTGQPLPRQLADPTEWQRLWQEATTWAPEEEAEAACPYPGLIAFGGANRDLFFGRTRATTDLTDLVRAADGPVVVIGASGAGKSSLLAAGLIPALSEWETALFTPGARPTAALRTIVETARAESDSRPTAAPDDTAPQAAAEHAGPRAALEHTEPDLRRVTPALAPRAEGPRRLLVIDQAEELFTACADDREREAFLTLLHTCATRADDPVAVVLALRADFYAHCLNHLVLQEALEHRSFLLGPMRTEELAQAISGPARAVGLDLENGLEELVITELCGAGGQHDRRAYDPGALPLLSHVMAATWQYREGRRLTVSGYRKAGGVVGSVAETAEYAWNELSPGQRAAARDLLLGLVTVTRDARDTRRPGVRTDLLAHAADAESATAALELLAATRLITLDAETVTLTHEIVLTAWPRLRSWIDEDRVGYLVRQRLETDAAEWAGQERDSSLLYQGARLENALEHVDPPPAGPLATEFLTAATTARTKSRRRATWIRARLALFAVAVLVFGFSAYTQTRLADQRRDDRDFAAVLAEADRVQQSDPSLAAQLNLIAWRMRPDDRAVRSRLFQTQDTPLATVTPAHATAIERIVYRPDGKILISSAANTLRFWDNADPQHPKPLSVQPLPLAGSDPRQPDATPLELTGYNSASFSSDGTLLATTSASDGQTRHIVLWDVSIPATPRRLSTVTEPPDSNYVQVAFVPGGRTLAVLTATKFSLWNAVDPAAPVRVSSRQIPLGVSDHLSLRINPTGRWLTVTHASLEGVSPMLDLWNITDPANPTPVTPAGEPIPAGRLVAFTPDGATLAVVTRIRGIAASDTTVELWDVSDPARAHRYSTVSTGSNYVGALEFASDGRIFATTSTDGTTLWNMTDPARPTRYGATLPGNPGKCRYTQLTVPCKGAPTTLAFAPGGRTLVTGDARGEIRTWSLPVLLTAPDGQDAAAAFDRTGTRLVTFSDNGRIIVWDLRNPDQPSRIGDYRTEPGFIGATLSADGNTLLTRSSPDGSYVRETQHVFDLSDPARIRVLGDPAFPGAQYSPSVSPDLRLAAATNADNTIQLWDMSDPVHPKPVGDRLPTHTAYPRAFFDANGATLTVSEIVGDTNTAELLVTLWNVADPARPGRVADLLRQPAVAGDQIMVTPDHRTMVVIANDTFQNWDISNPTRPVRLGDPVPARTLNLASIRFTTDSRTMITTGIDGAARLWNITDPAHPAPTDALAESGSTSITATFSPDNRHVAITTAYGPIKLWDTDLPHAVARVCDTTSDIWTESLWRHHLPQLPYRPPCPAH